MPSESDLARLPGLLRERGMTLGTPLTILDETTSTNDEAKVAAKGGAPHGATWIAELQTAGRGRQGRAWVSPRGENIMLSALVRIVCPPLRVPLMSLVAGLAARDAVARAVADAARVRLKWPNDVLIDGRKVCGILVEAQFASNQVESIVIGVGMNVHTRVFPEPIRDLATSVALHAPHAGSDGPDRAVLAADLLQALERDLPRVASHGLAPEVCGFAAADFQPEVCGFAAADFQPEVCGFAAADFQPLHARLTAADALLGQRVQSDGGISGVAEGIDLEGRLLVRRDDGALERLVAGEVHLNGVSLPHWGRAGVGG